MVQHQSFDPLTQPMPEVETPPEPSVPGDQTWEAVAFLIGWPGALVTSVAGTFLVMDGSLFSVVVCGTLFAAYLAAMTVVWVGAAAVES
jgi:hypothetical protein